MTLAQNFPQGLPLPLPYVVITTDTTLGPSHWGKLAVAVTGNGNTVTVSLPNYEVADVYKWIVIMKYIAVGTGSVKVQTSNNGAIGESNIGGYLLNDETRKYPFLCFMASGGKQWTPGLPYGGYGIWKVA